MNKKECNMLCCVVVIAVLINLILPQIVVAVRKNGDHGETKNVWKQMMNMLEHHARTPVSSSIVVAVIVVVSMYVCCCCVKK